MPTLQDIVKELVKPGRDPRSDLPAPILRTDVLELKDLKPGMVLTGTVRNVIDFGSSSTSASTRTASSTSRRSAASISSTPPKSSPSATWSKSPSSTSTKNAAASA